MNSAGDRSPPCTTPVFAFMLFYSCFQEMNFGSSVLHIVVEPASVCGGYVVVMDTMEQLLMVHIVECYCQIEPDEYYSVSLLFS